MMKTKLKFLLVLLAVLVGGVNSAWAQGADETYDFAAWATSGLSISYGADYAGTGLTNAKYWDIIGNGSTEHNIEGRFASRAQSGKGWYLRNNNTPHGLWNNGSGHSPELAICNLYTGDRVKVTISGLNMKFVSGNASINGTTVIAGETILTSNTIFTAESNGDIIITTTGTNNYDTQITKIEIYYSNNRVYNFKDVQKSEELAPGGQSDNVDTHDGYKLNFIQPLDVTKSYDGYFYHPDNFRFFVYQQGWQVGEEGLHYTGSESFPDFYILNVKKDDKVIVNFGYKSSYTGGDDVAKFYSTSTSYMDWGASMTNGTEYTMQNNGTLHLAINKNVYIQSIQIKSIDIRFSKLIDTYDLVMLGYTEPTLIGVPSGATVSYTGNNPQVAIPNSSTGDLMIVNTGDVTITATATLNNVSYTASYTLTVKASEAKWAIRNGNECYFPGSDDPTSKENTGKLLVRKVTSVPYMTMEFGEASNSNLSMVTFRNGVRAANQIDENGWQHVWLQNKIDYTMEPYQGTFYIFKPSISGKLTIKGVRNHNGSGANTVVLVDKDATVNEDWGTDFSQGKRTRYYVNTIDAQGNSSDGDKYYSYVIVKTLTFANNDTYAVTEEQIDLTGGHTYYLYANTPNTNGVRTINRQSNTDQTIGNGSNDWQAFYLSGFKFETPNFKFPYQNVVMGATAGTLSDVYHRETLASSYRQYVGTGTETNIVYSRICKGDISCNINSSTGELSGINGHGAIVVTASMMDGETELATTSYVLTVPYTTITSGGRHTWKFNVKDYGTEGAANMMEQIDALKSNAPAKEWSIQYKVRRYDSGTDALNYINVPVLANALEVRGDNARYISSTAGLLINANANTFGTTTTVKDTEYKTEILGDGIGRVYKMVNSEWVEQTSSADIDIALKTLLNYNASDAVDPCNYLTLENGSSFTIPNLKEGQHIRIKWSRYSGNHGDLISVTNLNDLNGTSITDAFTIGAGGNVNLNGGTGCHEFIVAADGDVTFTVSQDGWVNIYQIDVDDSFIETELTLKTTSTWELVENPNGTTEWKERGWADAPLTYIRKATGGEAITEKYTENFGGTLSQSNSTCTVEK